MKVIPDLMSTATTDKEEPLSTPLIPTPLEDTKSKKETTSPADPGPKKESPTLPDKTEMRIPDLVIRSIYQFRYK